MLSLNKAHSIFMNAIPPAPPVEDLWQLIAQLVLPHCRTCFLMGLALLIVQALSTLHPRTTVSCALQILEAWQGSPIFKITSISALTQVWQTVMPRTQPLLSSPLTTHQFHSQQMPHSPLSRIIYSLPYGESVLQLE